VGCVALEWLATGNNKQQHRSVICSSASSSTPPDTTRRHDDTPHPPPHRQAARAALPYALQTRIKALEASRKAAARGAAKDVGGMSTKKMRRIIVEVGVRARWCCGGGCRGDCG